MLSFLRATGLVILSFVFSFILLEVALRFFPVNQGLHTFPVNQENPILHFEPNRTSVWSKFANFSMTNTVHSNNDGFINDQNYTDESKIPLITVIGDSYVEAAMIPYDQTLHGRLAKTLNNSVRVYSFGASGAPLSQYLAYAGYVSTKFHPEKMIFVIVGNDFDESIFSAASSPGFHYFRISDQGDLELIRKDYSPPWMTKIVRQSHLAMYLATNVQIQFFVDRFKAMFSKPKTYEFAGQTSTTTDPLRMQPSKLAVEKFLELLPKTAGLAPTDILFVVDGIRPNLYDPVELEKEKSSFFSLMRQNFISKARSKGYLVVDMQPIFQSDHLASGRKFEFPKDGHWNAEGHALAAKEVLKSDLLIGLH